MGTHTPGKRPLPERTAADLLDALILALPYVEAAEHDDHYKAGEVARVTRKLRSAIQSGQDRLAALSSEGGEK